MEENKSLLAPESEELDLPVATDETTVEPEAPVVEPAEEDVPLDRNVKLMSPTRMVVRRFFRSRLSIVGLIMVVSLFLFSFVGPLIFAEEMHKETVGGVQVEAYTPDNGKWGEIELDESGRVDYSTVETTYEVDGVTYTVYQTTETQLKDNFFASPSSEHILGTDKEGYDIFVRLMYGGRISLIVSFLAVVLITLLGVVLGFVAASTGSVVPGMALHAVYNAVAVILSYVSAGQDTGVYVPMIEQIGGAMGVAACFTLTLVSIGLFLWVLRALDRMRIRADEPFGTDAVIEHKKMDRTEIILLASGIATVVWFYVQDILSML